MSNLYKHRNIISDNTNKRVINSNNSVAEKLEELSKTANLPEDLDEGEFAEGLDSYAPPLPTEEDITIKMEQAKEEAEQIIEAAKQEAAKIKQQAAARAKEKEEQARQSGLAQGLDEGRAQAKEELDEQLLQLDKKEQQLLDDYQNKLEDLEPKLVNVITGVFEKVFHVHFDDKKEILIYLIQNAILNVEGSKEFQIRVCEENYLFLEDHKQEILERVGQNIVLDIISDSLMKENQCTIETDSGVFECGLGVQLENLIKALRSLSL